MFIDQNDLDYVYYHNTKDVMRVTFVAKHNTFDDISNLLLGDRFSKSGGYYSLLFKQKDSYYFSYYERIFLEVVDPKKKRFEFVTKRDVYKSIKMTKKNFLKYKFLSLLQT